MDLTIFMAAKTKAFKSRWVDAQAAVVIGFVLQATIAGAQNLATNPGFETGTTTGWTTMGSPTISVETNQVHSGNYAGLVTNRTATWNGIAQSFEGVLQQNQTYNISAWVRLVNGTNQTMQLTIQQVDGNGTGYSSFGSSFVSSTNWTQLAGQFTFNYSGILTSLVLYAEVPSSTNASYYIDDLVVQPVNTSITNGACTVDWATVFQRIDGFGASSAWDGNWTTNQADMYFSTNSGVGTSFDGTTNFLFTGVGLSLLRNHIAPANSTSASDAASTWETGIMQMAQTRGARVWSTPWTPAAGFKSINDIYDDDRATDGGIDGGSYLGSGNNITNVNYASQLANYVASMKSQGINLYAISVQNEPDADVTTYEACQWTGAQIHDFVTNLYSALAAEGVGSTKIIIPESESWSSDTALYTPTLNDPSAAADVGIIANHDYVEDNSVGDQTTPAALNTSGKAFWETEVSQLGGSYDGSITNAIYWAGRIHLFMTAAQANAWHYWWLVPAGSDNAALVDTNGIPAKRMYALGQFARFVRPDYYRINIATNSSSAQISAYKDSTSANFAIVAINSGLSNVIQVFNLTNVTGVFGITPWITSATMSLSNQTPVAVSGSSFTYTLPPLSIVTFVSAPLQITSTADSGAGTLREAVACANTDPGGGDITFDPALSGQSITLTSGQIVISNNVTIDASGLAGGLVISGNNNSRILYIAPTGTVTVNSLSFVSGSVSNDSGGAIWNSGNLTVQNCRFTNNVAQGGAGQTPGPGSNGGGGGGGAGMGGAIFSDGIVLNLTNSVFSGNSAVGGKGGGGVNNGGSANPGGNGGGPEGGLGGAVGNAGGAGGYGGGGGGGAGSFDTGSYAGGAGGYGGGGGGGGAKGESGTGGQGGIEGTYGGNGGLAAYSWSGGGGGGAGLGGAVFAETGPITVVACTFTGNLATNGLVGANSYNGQSGQGVGGALFSVVTNVFVQNSTFSNNVASSYAPDMDWPLLVFTLADNGPGSLRQVLTNAANGNRITFSLSGTITLTNGPLNITNSVNILGPGPGALTVSGNNASGVFNVTGTNVTISGLTIADGQSTLNGAGINAVGSPGSVLTVGGCVLTNNTAALNGGGIFNGPGVTMTVSNCIISGNSAESGGGGGIYSTNATLTVVASTLNNNSGGVGGGIMNDGQNNGNATLTVNVSTISGNSAYEGGGGILNWGQSGSATLTINASTLSGNSAGGSGGGGIFNNGSSGSGTLEIGDTILNAGAEGGNIYNYQGTVISAGYNLSSDNGGGFLTATNDQINTDPLLGPLQDNGGPTWTCALLPGSPAIDQGKRNAIPALACNTDQRGFPRPCDNPYIANAPGGDGSDIGAYEVQYIAVSNAADSGPGSLRDAVANSVSGGIIAFATNLSGQTITLTSGELLLNQNLTIDASALSNGLSINGNNAGRVFDVSDATVVLNSLTITNGGDNNDPNYGGGGIVIWSGNLTLTNCTVAGNSANNSHGGGILIDSGNLTLDNCTVAGNSANNGYGGSIFNNGGTLTVNNCTVAGNSANNGYGGGIFNNGGTLTVNQSTVSGNSAGGGGGGICNAGDTLTVNQSTLSGNSANYSYYGGGGILNYSGTLTVNQSTLSGNSANNSSYLDGGGICNAGGTVTVNQSTLTGNSANNFSYFGGGGILNVATLTLYNSIVAGNVPNNLYNLVTTTSTGVNLTSGDPLLAPLGNYGGPTLTMLPLFGSPAIDACTNGSSFTTDQRGYPRLSGAHVDIGAVEAQWAPANLPPTLTDSAWTAPGGARCFQFTFSSVTNADFTVLATTNLALPLPDWTMLAPVIQCSPDVS